MKIFKIITVAFGVFLVGFLAGNLNPFGKTGTDCKATGANVIGADQQTQTTDQTQTTNQPSDTKTDNSTAAKTTDTSNKITPVSGDLLDTTTTSYLGSENAPVTIIEYTDYQCPYCQRYFFDAFPQIQKNYIKTGKIKYIVKNMPLSFHSLAKPASYATHCAGEQNKFWPIHKKLFLYQNDWAYADNPDQKFSEYAFSLSLDTDKFNKCMATAEKTFGSVVDANIQEAMGLGISGTPSFSINGKVLIGAQPYEQFTKVIDSLLK